MTIREELEAARQAELLTVRQLALLSQYSEKTVYAKASAGEIPGVVRWGRSIRFVRAVAFAWSRAEKDARNLST